MIEVQANLGEVPAIAVLASEVQAILVVALANAAPIARQSITDRADPEPKAHVAASSVNSKTKSKSFAKHSKRCAMEGTEAALDVAPIRRMGVVPAELVALAEAQVVLALLDDPASVAQAVRQRTIRFRQRRGMNAIELATEIWFKVEARHGLAVSRLRLFSGSTLPNVGSAHRPLNHSTRIIPVVQQGDFCEMDPNLIIAIPRTSCSLPAASLR